MEPDIEAIDTEIIVSLEELELPFDSAQGRPEEAERPIEGPRILGELVIEEISIDGMCGVY